MLCDDVIDSVMDPTIPNNGTECGKKRKLNDITPTLTGFDPITIKNISVNLNQSSGWLVKGRILSKGLMSKTSQQKIPLIKFTLVDSQETVISVIAKGDQAFRVCKEIELDQVYLIRKPTVIENNNNSQFLQLEITRDSEIILSTSSSVNQEIFRKHCAFPVSLDSVLSVRQLDQNDQASGSVHMMGYVCAIGFVQTVGAQQKEKYDFYVFDHSNEIFAVSVWSCYEPYANFAVGDLVYMENIRISKYNNKRQYTLGYDSAVYKISPAVSFLWDFWSSRKIKPPLISAVCQRFPYAKISTKSTFSEALEENAERTTISPTTRTVADILKEGFGSVNLEETPVSFVLEGYLRCINLNRPLFYMACPSCRRKMTNTQPGLYQCQATEKCIQQPPNIVPDVEYAMNVVLCDSQDATTSLENCMIFGKVGAELLGLPAKTLADNKSSLSSEEYAEWWTNTIFEPIRQIRYKFSITAAIEKSNSYNNGVRKIQFKITHLSHISS